MSERDRPYGRRPSNVEGSAYPRYPREAYDERTVRELDRTNPPYAPRVVDSPPERRHYREEQRERRPQPPPVRSHEWARPRG